MNNKLFELTKELMNNTLEYRVKTIIQENCLYNINECEMMKSMCNDPEVVEPYSNIAKHIIGMHNPDDEKRIAIRLIKVHGPKKAFSILTTNNNGERKTIIKKEPEEDFDPEQPVDLPLNIENNGREKVREILRNLLDTI